MEQSDCCGANRWNDTDLCIECKEHSGFTEVEDTGFNARVKDFMNKYKYNK